MPVPRFYCAKPIYMALRILDTCVNCDVCAPACPNQAISQGEVIYDIAPQRCTECVGHYDEPQCIVVCPVECIEKDPNHVENTEQLLEKLALLQQESAA
jgi:ferredoxin